MEWTARLTRFENTSVSDMSETKAAKKENSAKGDHDRSYKLDCGAFERSMGKFTCIYILFASLLPLSLTSRSFNKRIAALCPAQPITEPAG